MMRALERRRDVYDSGPLERSERSDDAATSEPTGWRIVDCVSREGRIGWGPSKKPPLILAEITYAAASSRPFLGVYISTLGG